MYEGKILTTNRYNNVEECCGALLEITNQAPVVQPVKLQQLLSYIHPVFLFR